MIFNRLIINKNDKKDNSSIPFFEEFFPATITLYFICRCPITYSYTNKMKHNYRGCVPANGRLHRIGRYMAH